MAQSQPRAGSRQKCRKEAGEGRTQQRLEGLKEDLRRRENWISRQLLLWSPIGDVVDMAFMPAVLGAIRFLEGWSNVF